MHLAACTCMPAKIEEMGGRDEKRREERADVSGGRKERSVPSIKASQASSHCLASKTTASAHLLSSEQASRLTLPQHTHHHLS